MLATGVGLEANFSGLRVVCGSCLVASSGFWRGGPSAQKTRVLGGRNAPLYHTGTTQCCSYGLDDRQCHSNGPISQVGQWLHAISWRLHTRGKERQGYQRNGVQTAREATSGLAGCICSKSVPMTRGWQGQVAVSQVRHAVFWRLLHTRDKERQGDQRNGGQSNRLGKQPAVGLMGAYVLNL